MPSSWPWLTILSLGRWISLLNFANEVILFGTSSALDYGLDVLFVVVISLALYDLFPVAPQMLLIDRGKPHSSARGLVLHRGLNSNLSLLVHFISSVISFAVLFLILLQAVAA